MSTEYTTPTINNAKLKSFIKGIEKLTDKIKLAEKHVGTLSNKKLVALKIAFKLADDQIAKFAIKGLGRLNDKLSFSGKKIKDFSNKFKDAAKSVAENTKEIRAKISDFAKESIIAGQNKAANELRFKNNLELKLNVNPKQVKGIMNLIEGQQNNGVVSSDVQMVGAQQLANYVGNVDSIYKLIPAMNDLFVKQTGISGTSDEIMSTADIMGQALTGNTEELEKAGIEFSEEQKNILKSGTEQQKIVALKDAVNKKAGGENKKTSLSDEGAIKKATIQYEALKAQIGAMLLPYLAKFAKWFSKNQPAIQDFISKIGSACKKIYNSVKKVYKFIKKHPKLAVFIAVLIIALLIFIKIVSFVKTIAFVLGLFGIAIDLGPILAFVGAIIAAAVAIGLLIANWGSLKKAVSDANETPLIAKNSNTVGLLSDVNLNLGSKKKGGEKKNKENKSDKDKTLIGKKGTTLSWQDAAAYLADAQGDNTDLYKSLSISTAGNNKITENKNVTFGNVNITAKGVTSKEVINEIVPQLKLQLANM